MKVQIICPVFPPESVASAVMAQHISKGLVNNGHVVTIITSFPSKMRGEIFPGFRRKLFQKEIHEGYSLIRVFTFFSKKSTITSRLLENISFAIMSNFASILSVKPDVVFLNTWPVISTFITGIVCKLRKLSYVYNVQDMYPESAVGLEIIHGGSVLAQLLLRMDRITMQNAACIVPISEEFATKIRKSRGIEYNKISVVWNWYDAIVTPGEKWNEYRKEIAPAHDICVVMYAGNIGSVAGLEIVLNAAEILEKEGKYVFVLAGDGTLRQGFQTNCKNRGITNVVFYHPLERENLAYVQSAADILLITTKKDLSLSEVPSKIMAYMLSGRPVLAMVDEKSNTAKVIHMANCGLIGPAGDAQALANLVRKMKESDQLAAWGKNARTFALDHFDQEMGTKKIVAIIESIPQ